MKAKDLTDLLNDVGFTTKDVYKDYNVRTKGGAPVTGIWIDHEKGELVIVSRDTWIERD